jgi:hypothetical protein
MTNVVTSEITLLLIIGFLFIVSFFIYPVVITPREIKQVELNKLTRITATLALGTAVAIIVFLSITRLATETSFESPPHGINSGIWDNFETEENGTLFSDMNTGEQLVLDDLVLKYISRERYLRYIRPPFLRKSCYTGQIVACKWTNIDITNFENSKEWSEFLMRLIIGAITGMATGVITLRYTKSKEIRYSTKAG